MWGTEWPRFEVIKQDAPKSPPQMVGSVHATDPEHALLVARHVFVRRPSAFALHVAPAEAFFHVTQEGLRTLEPEGEGTERVYWVFARQGHRRSMVYGDLVGRFPAKGPKEAVLKARAQVEGVAFYAVPEEALSGIGGDPATVESWFEPAKTKTYRLQAYYGLVSAKGGRREP